MGGHAAGEPFLLLDARSIKVIPASASAMGADVTATAYGPGNDAEPPTVGRTIQAEAVRPLSSGHLAGELTADGSLALSWIRRSRRGWAWIDEVDVPPDPDLIGYRIGVAGSSGSREWTVTDSQLLIPAAELASLGAGPLTISAKQVGAFGVSRPATIIITA